jgi:PEP-CTERM/exosortase A-associated glycosyltransferase
MRVLHVLHTSLPFICGYSIRSDYILRFQREQGFDPAVVTSAQHPEGETPCEEIQGFTHWRTPAGRMKRVPLVREWQLMRSLQKRVEEAIHAWRPDIIHAHSPMLVGLPALRAAQRAGLPLVYEVRDLWENASVDRGKFGEGSPAYRLARRMETHVLRQANAVVTICEKLREELAPRTGQPGKLFVVGNGVDAENFTPMPCTESVRQRWGMQDKQVIGYIGTFQPYEGLDLLIHALPHILKQKPQAHLVITGSGGQEPQLRSLASALDLEDHVTFTGRLPHNQVSSIYALADMMVYPRILTRTTALTTPLKPLEAMAMGKAVMVSDVPAMQELVQPGVTGLMFRAGDVMDLASQCTSTLQSSQQREQLGRKARAWILTERQWPILVGRYREIYTAAA